MNTYPECEKLSAVSGESNKIGAFLDWLNEQHIVLADYQEHCDHIESRCAGERCDMDHEIGSWACGKDCEDYAPTSGNQLFPIRKPIESLLANYFEIDLAKVEKERRQILEDIRKQNEDAKK